jgi:cytochrome oxidase assembly protein ShyY1
MVLWILIVIGMGFIALGVWQLSRKKKPKRFTRASFEIPPQNLGKRESLSPSDITRIQKKGLRYMEKK